MSKHHNRNGAWRRKALAKIAERDGWVCGICGESIDPTVQYPHDICATVDHIIPRSRGGSYGLDNLRLAHQQCNRVRGDTFAHAQVRFVEARA